MKNRLLFGLRRPLPVFLALLGVGGAGIAALVALTPAIAEHCRQVPTELDPRFRLSYLEGASPESPTCLQFGPDHRLYVSCLNGEIEIYTLSRRPGGGYRVSGTEIVLAVRGIPNHNDDGQVNPDVTARLITGLLVKGTADSPVLYVCSSDPRIENSLTDTNSGVISRLTRSGGGWQREDLIRGLPRSRSDHASNGLYLDEESSILYVVQGSNTNAGAPSRQFGFLPEYALSAAILSIDLKALPVLPYDLPTLDDEDRPGSQDENDPFGGNSGKNQAVLISGGPVQLYATGLRNAYDLVRTDHGFYVVDNGPNQAYGGPPRVDTDGKATNEAVEPSDHYPNALHHVPQAGYYGGHPNPTRANRRNVFNPSNPQSPVEFENPMESQFREPSVENGALCTFNASTNGLVAYGYSGLGMEDGGTLLTVGVDTAAYLLTLDPAGERLLDRVRILKGAGGMFLDVTVDASHDPHSGTVWIADYGDDRIVALEPDQGPGISRRLRRLSLTSQQSGCEVLRFGRRRLASFLRKIPRAL